jgi:hypothetical protein
MKVLAIHVVFVNQGVKNPIKLARSVLDYSRTPDKLGRIPPLSVDPDLFLL